MKLREIFLTTVGVLSACWFAACSGSGGGAETPGVGCEGGTQGMCVTRCNLGCSATGCNISEIAINQTLSFDFNLDINPDTVNSDTIRIRTDDGKEPVGSFFVQGGTVFFFPQASVIGEKTFFGFESGETYSLTIPSRSDSLNTVESMSGDGPRETFSCRLNVSRGVVDLDGKQPTAQLVIPSNSECVSGETLVLVEFSEIVDAAALLDPSGSGVRVSVAQRNNGNCNTFDVPIDGQRSVSVQPLEQRSRLLIRPFVKLPSDFCLRVQVTSGVRDLSGKRARPATFEFVTCEGTKEEQVLEDDFSDLGRRDDVRNGALWAAGAVTPGLLGGGGRLGDFDPRDGGVATELRDSEGRAIFQWNTDDATISKLRTLTGDAITVSNGVFEFSSFFVRRGEHVRFVGSQPVVLRCTGRMQIEGAVSVAGQDAVRPESVVPIPRDGQDGFAGGAGGSRGGRGGDSPQKPDNPVIHGSDGGAAVLPNGHPLASMAPATAGRGSRANPESGLATDACFTAYKTTSPTSQQGAAGGGGGGSVGAGQAGRCVDNGKGLATHPPESCDFGRATAASSGIDLPSLLGRLEKSRFLNSLGGAGGGGAGAHTHGAIPAAIDWSPGSGGAGGGGVLQLEAGGDLFVGTTGIVTAKGGSAPTYGFDIQTFFNPAPGGAGGGGTILAQIGGLIDLRGPIVATGGDAGRLDADDGFRLRLDCLSGAGGDGHVRIEADPAATLQQLGTVRPTAQAHNTGRLRAIDHADESLLATEFRDTRQLFPPRYVRYELDATVGTRDVTFSDDPSKGLAADESQPLTILFQGAQLDPETQLPIDESLTPWAAGTIGSLNNSASTAFRYFIRFRKDQAQPLVVKAVRIYIVTD